MLKSKPIELINVTKKFGDMEAVSKFNLSIPPGEFVTLLGPSGCGKTTLLRMIAGLEQVSEGKILMDGKDITNVPANRRDTSIMFQDYALFPHKTILNNVGFGLKARGLPRSEWRQKAKELLQFVELQETADRRPNQLSGGQRQRVALARSLIIEPAILLLDEPLGALDAILRRRMQVELKRVQRKIGLTFIYVTHDQEEALTMSDRVVVMNEGKIKQIGDPYKIYNCPRTEFVAKFIGHCNVLSVLVNSLSDDTVNCNHAHFGTIVATNPNNIILKKGDFVKMALRPEKVFMGEEANSLQNKGIVKVCETIFLGSIQRRLVEDGDGNEITIETSTNHLEKDETETLIGWNQQDCIILQED
jgi:spermidine/putrescine transport system ATP-binding protein